jgi:hypothetical protein
MLARHGQFFKGFVPPIKGVSGSRFAVAQTWAMAGQEDVELVRMRYETTSAFTATSGNASYLQVKGNSIYRPYPGNTDSPAGFQRLFTQYERSMVLGSRITVNLWSDTGAGVQQPFRIAVVPCTATQYTTYSGFANVAALRGVPHSSEALFSPGAKMPVLSASGTTAQILLGFKEETAVESVGGSGYQGTVSADPTTVWYFLVGLQAMAGTTTLNAQLQVLIEFDVMFLRPIPTAVQSVTINRWGNEEVPEKKFDARDDDLKTRARVEYKTQAEPEYELVSVPIRRSHFAADTSLSAAGRSPGAPVAPGSVATPLSRV